MLDTEARGRVRRHRAARGATVPGAGRLVTSLDEGRHGSGARRGSTPKRRRAKVFLLARHRPAGMFVVGDATADERFASSHLVLRQGIRFYAGVPSSPRTSRARTLCVIDRVPRELTGAGGGVARVHTATALLELSPPRRAGSTDDWSCTGGARARRRRARAREMLARERSARARRRERAPLPLPSRAIPQHLEAQTRRRARLRQPQV